jgi:DNA helicase-2/ATP-dependent DNA helicase PcrA
MIQITDNDISKMEQLFLPSGESFCVEKREILKCMESKDIVACPGSGKTTTLLAKLAIIGEHLPLTTNKGVCVLTHTNVAIDEIKNRLGENSKKLFEYPNFFGTIQTFVNKFLAIPYFHKVYRSKVESIDDEFYNREIIREFHTLERNIKFGLKNKYNESQLLYEAIQNMRISLTENSLINRNTNNKLFKTENATSVALMDMKKRVMSRGILCYDDAYWLAYRHLVKHEKQLKELFSSRFEFVFIDEMQDTSIIQSRILNNLFNKESVVIQRFGDPNQSIYDNGNSDESAWSIWNESLKISNSKRFSEGISRKIIPFEINRSGMRGRCDNVGIQPKILIFEEEGIHNVLPAFANIIVENGLNSNKNVFKAVGRIGKNNDNGKLTISNFFPDFNKKVVKQQPKYLVDYLNTIRIEHQFNTLDIKPFRDSILDAFLKELWIMDVKRDGANNYSKKALLKMLNSDHNTIYLNLIDNLYEWCLKLKMKQDIKTEYLSFSKMLFAEVFGIIDLTRLERFYNGEGQEYNADMNENIYTHTPEETDHISIHIDTIAGVKGETHTATLYLETFYYNYDVNLLIELFKGKSVNIKGVRKISAAKNSYVGMSRPTSLLCVAAQKSSIAGHEGDLKSAGWELVTV